RHLGQSLLFQEDVMGIRAMVAVFLILGGAAGCQPGPKKEPTPPPGALARCGGMGPPPGFKDILAGTDNPFFTARTRQQLKIKPDVEVKAQLDDKGNTVGLTMMARDNQVGVNCNCPAGCSSDPGQGHGCVVVYTPGGPDASCSGDCVTETSCCSGCGWMS